MQVDQTNQVHPITVDAFSDCLRLIRLEYTEMPGLHLSKCQARRLWNLDSRSCDVIFEALEASHFLRRLANDSYVRADIGVDRVSTVMRRGSRIAVIVGLLGAALMVTVAADQTTGPRTPPLVAESMHGPDLFHWYCATCHGQDGKGQGPVAPALKTPPPDLTQLTRRNGGVFPRARLESSIAAGPAMPTHGSAYMPVWGPIFRSLDPSDARVKVRINNLVSHIASIQQK